jgi:hypothetical protein
MTTVFVLKQEKIMELPMTREVFHKHLRDEKNHHEFAEDGDTLRSRLADLKILKNARGRTHAFGIVIPELDCETRRAVMKLLCPQQWTVTIDFNAKVKVDGRSYSYTHIKFNA